MIIDELLSIENWQNRAKNSNPVLTLVLSNSPETSAPKRKHTRYFEPFPKIKQIEVTNEKNKELKLFLKNENLWPFYCTMQKEQWVFGSP